VHILTPIFVNSTLNLPLNLVSNRAATLRR
jgi:hypothetical protein